MPDLYGLDELGRRVLDKGLCASCGACTALCPYLTSFRGKAVILDRCTIEQGRCFAYCPMTFFDAEEASRSLFGVSDNDASALGHVKEIVATKSTDAGIAGMGQGGGTVSALTAWVLEKGMIDAAVLTGPYGKDPFAGGMVAVTVSEILACSGSRYVGAHGLTALREALDHGYRRIAVVGLPCQIRALRKMALYDLKGEGLKDRIALTIGLFCNWAFSGREFAAFLSARPDLPQVKRFHIPPPPANVMELETVEGLTTIPLDEMRPMIQAACRACPDMTSEFADVSVGMYEGKDGWNTTIVRTETGRSLFEAAVAGHALEMEPFPEAKLLHLARASRNKKTRASGM